MNPGSKRLLPSLAVALLIFGASPLTADETPAKVDRLFAQWDSTVSPGCALAVIKDGQIIYKRGYGMAKLEDGIVMTPDKIFDIGSVSKQFTAALIAMLAREGKISLDDDVHKYLPQLPRYERPMTIRHLIHHTSGLRDYNLLLSLAGFRPESDCPNVDEALEVIFAQKRLNYPAGEEYSYTNSGYFLLGQIVEMVSGKTLNEFAQERIFRPLGMAHTLYQDNHLQVIKNRATGYDQTDQGFQLNLSNWDETGDGNVYTSVEDLYLWDQAFYNHKLGGELMEMLHEVGVLNDGKKLDYAFGLVVGEYKGLKNVGHGGAWAGFRAAISRFPEQKFSVICLANLSSIEPSGLCHRVADIYLAGLLKEPAKEEKKKPEPVVLTPQELEQKTGNYRAEKTRTWVSLSRAEDKLRMAAFGREFILVPTSKTTFEVALAPVPISLEFLPESPGQPPRALLRARGEKRILVKTKPLPSFKAAELREYAGEYLSEELLGATYRLYIKNDKLMVKFRSLPNIPLQPMTRDAFTADYASLDFVRHKGKTITGFTLSAGRAAGIEFVKKRT
ncbi:MAG: serine hydrolase domain-containing protein [Acidobacteriota bacterium]